MWGQDERCKSLEVPPSSSRPPVAMKTVLATRYVDIPDDVKLEVSSRIVKVTGPRGELTQSFKHLKLDMQKVGKKKLRVDLWFGNRKQV